MTDDCERLGDETVNRERDGVRDKITGIHYRN